MAVRYTGDFTIHLRVERRRGESVYVARIVAVDWYRRKRQTLTLSAHPSSFGVGAARLRDSDSYDRAARGFAKAALDLVRWAKSDRDALGCVEVQRVFQAPSPR